MQRYFVTSEIFTDSTIAKITGQDVHHISNVMRAKITDQLILCSDNKQTYLVEIIEITKNEVTVKKIDSIIENRELPVDVTIAQGIIKSDKFDWVIQKATECGATSFIPLSMKRSIAKIDEKTEIKKRQRWQKIASEATRQSHRQIVPLIEPILNLSELIKRKNDFDICLFAYEIEGTESKHKLHEIILKIEDIQRVLVVIGPEGGIDETEVQLLIENGFSAIGLGPRILRTETAPIYLLSAISYGLEIERRI